MVSVFSLTQLAPYIAPGAAVTEKRLSVCTAAINRADDKGFTALHWLCTRGTEDLDTCKLLVRMGADVNALSNVMWYVTGCGRRGGPNDASDLYALFIPFESTCGRGDVWVASPTALLGSHSTVE